jgi:hypothetical protein
MKTSGKLLSVFGIIAGLIVGFFIGISVEYPKVDNNMVSGTIGKVNNYRKAQSSITEIELKNELISDTVKLKAIQQYLNFYYLTAVKMSGDIQFVISEANAVEAFKTTNQRSITNLSSYAKFLSSARTDLLLAIAVSKEPAKTDPVMLKDILNQANNMIAQLNFKNKTVLEFIDLLALYINDNKTDNIEELKKAHDQLVLNEINSAIITHDKPIIKSFDKKELFSDVEKLTFFDRQSLDNLMKQDIEKLGSWDVETLGIFDTEKLGVTDKEKLNLVNDFEQLQVIMPDAERLGAGYTDTEKLGANFTDAEKLGRIMDAEKLGRIMDAEKLGFYNDAETLGSLLN